MSLLDRFRQPPAEPPPESSAADNGIEGERAASAVQRPPSLPLVGLATTGSASVDASTGAGGLGSGINLWAGGTANFGRRNPEGEITGAEEIDGLTARLATAVEAAG